MTGATIRAAFLTACEEEWHRCVQAGPDDDIITEYFRAIGWQWKLDMYGDDGKYSEAIRSRTGFMNYCGIGPAAAGMTQLYIEIIDADGDVAVHAGPAGMEGQ